MRPKKILAPSMVCLIALMTLPCGETRAADFRPQAFALPVTVETETVKSSAYVEALVGRESLEPLADQVWLDPGDKVVADFIRAARSGDSKSLLSLVAEPKNNTSKTKSNTDLEMAMKPYERVYGAANSIASPYRLKIGNITLYVLSVSGPEPEKRTAATVFPVEYLRPEGARWAKDLEFTPPAALQALCAAARAVEKSPEVFALGDSLKGNFLKIPLDEAIASEVGTNSFFLLLKGDVVRGDTVVLRNGVYVDGTSDVADADSASTLTFYRQACRAFAEIPEEKDFATGPKTTEYFALLTQESAARVRENLDKLDGSAEGFRGYKQVQRANFRSVLYVINASPVFYIGYSPEEREEASELLFDVVYSPSPGRFLLANVHYGTTFVGLLRDKMVQKALLAAVNGSPSAKGTE